MTPKWGENGVQNLTFGDKIQLKIQDAFSIQKKSEFYLKVDLLDLKIH